MISASFVMVVAAASYRNTPMAVASASTRAHAMGARLVGPRVSLRRGGRAHARRQKTVTVLIKMNHAVLVALRKLADSTAGIYALGEHGTRPLRHDLHRVRRRVCPREHDRRAHRPPAHPQPGESDRLRVR